MISLELRIDTKSTLMHDLITFGFTIQGFIRFWKPFCGIGKCFCIKISLHLKRLIEISD